MTTTLILGGARSGKSRYAEQLLRDTEIVQYVAPDPTPDGHDPEWAARVAEHRRRRPRGWQTLETADIAAAVRRSENPVLIDCLATWLTRIIDDIEGWDHPDRVSTHVAGRTADLLDAWQSARVDAVAVTNEVGMAVVPATAAGRVFRDELGRLNAAMAAVSDRVVLVVAGRVLDLTGCPVVEP